MEWISVKDRLPKLESLGEVCVLTYDGYSVKPLIYERALVRGKEVYRWRWMWDRIHDGNPITHWMPLPEAPEMKGNDSV